MTTEDTPTPAPAVRYFDSYGLAAVLRPAAVRPVMVLDIWHYGNDRRESVVTLQALTARLTAEAEYATDETTRAARRANVAACLSELQATGRSESWSWHTFTLQGSP